MFYGKHSTFSNFHPAQFSVNGITYSCSEQFYQSTKAKTFGDTSTASEIMATDDPVTMMRLGKQVSGFHEEQWEKTSREVMHQANLAKFTNNPAMLAELKATENKAMVECNKYDKYWGCGLPITSKSAGIKENWIGTNYMGATLEIVREQLS